MPAPPWKSPECRNGDIFARCAWLVPAQSLGQHVSLPGRSTQNSCGTALPRGGTGCSKNGACAPLYPCTRVPLYPCIPAPLYPCTHGPMYPCTLCTHALVHLCTHLPVHPHTPCTCAPTYPCTHAPLHPRTPVLVHPYTPAPQHSSSPARSRCGCSSSHHPAPPRPPASTTHRRRHYNYPSLFVQPPIFTGLPVDGRWHLARHPVYRCASRAPCARAVFPGGCGSRGAVRGRFSPLPPSSFWVRFCNRRGRLGHGCVRQHEEQLSQPSLRLPLHLGLQKSPLTPSWGGKGGPWCTYWAWGLCLPGAASPLQAQPGDPLARRMFAPHQWPCFGGAKGGAPYKSPLAAAGRGSAPFLAPSQCLNDHGAGFCPSMPPPLCRCGVQPQNPATLPPGVCGHLASGQSLALFIPQLRFRRAGSRSTGRQGLLDSLSPACLPPPAASRWLSPM